MITSSDLALPDFNQVFNMETDAFRTGLGEFYHRTDDQFFIYTFCLLMAIVYERELMLLPLPFKDGVLIC